MPQEQIKPTDAILYDENLTDDDRKNMMAFTMANRPEKSNSLFNEVREKEAMEAMDFAVKAILDHIIKMRGGGQDGNR